MSENLLIAFVGIGGVVIGALIGFASVYLQFSLTQKSENKKRIREVREKRIDKIEELSNGMYQAIAHVFALANEVVRENYDEESWEKIIKEMNENVMNKKPATKFILAAQIAPINDIKLANLVLELSKMMVEQDEILYGFAKLIKESDEVSNLEIDLTRTSELHNQATLLLSHIYQRLDYLRSN